MGPLSQEKSSVDAILGTPGAVCLLLGQSDVGKTTLIRDLVHRVTARGDSVAVLDADLGQASFGLPTTLTLVRFTGGATEPERIATFFVGAISPVGHLLPTLVGCRRLLDRALQLRVHTVLIDTTGLVAGPLGAELKLQKIDLLRPTQIFALAHGRELDPILQACSHRQDLTVRHLSIAATARPRSPEERRATRQGKYRQYFAQATLHRFSLDGVGLWGRLSPVPRQDAQGLLVGLLDGHGWCLGVGRLQAVTPAAVEVWTPYKAATSVHLLRFGSVAVDEQGTERLLSPRQ